MHESFRQKIREYPEQYQRGPDHLVTLEVLTERLTICNGCRHMEDGLCSINQAYRKKSLLRKAEMPCGKCPKHKWPEPEDERCEQPGFSARVWNLTKALTAFVADGLKTVTPEQYQERLQICDTCDRRQGGSCLECGCNLALKAKGRAFKCPLGKWPEAEQ